VRVLITRAPEQADALGDALRRRGATVHAHPVIAIVPPDDPRPLYEALARLGDYDWLLITSANAARVLGDLPEAVKIACVGQATARLVPRVDLIPERSNAEGLLDALKARLGDDLAGTRFLMPRAAEGRDVLPDGLRAAGAVVDVVTAYRTVPDPAGAEAIRDLLRRREVDVLTFTAPSTVRNFAAVLDDETGLLARVLPAVCMGPVTAQSAREAGFEVAAEAMPATVDGLARAVTQIARVE